MGTFILLLLVIAGLWASFFFRRPSASILRRLGQRLGGSYAPRRVGQPAQLRVPYGRTVLRVQQLQRPRGYVGAAADINWPDGATQVRIQSVAWPESAAAEPNWSHIATGHAEFDSQYELLAGDADRAARLLSEGVRWQLEKLRLAMGRPALQVSWQWHRLTIKKLMPVQRIREWELFVRLATELYDQSMLTLSSGIQFVEAGQVMPLEDPICQICGEAIREDMVFCPRCMTPHHRDCWQYNGACSTYGCDETRFVTPRIARAVEPPADHSGG